MNADVWLHAGQAVVHHALFPLFLTLAAYAAGNWMYRRAGQSPLVHPLIMAVAIVIIVLKTLGLSYHDYFESTRFLHWLLGPAIVALAVPLYGELKQLGARWRALMAGLVVGSVVAAVSAMMLVLLLVQLTVSRYQSRLEYLAATDALTGLTNRHALAMLLEQALREAVRHHQPLSLILLDIDHFKQINDEHGHLQGDQVLIRLATTLRASLRQSDIVCRWGGEEFLLVLPSTSLDGASRVAENLRQQIADLDYRIEDTPLAITISAGVTLLRPGDSSDSLIARADALLYCAKGEGRNRICADTPTQDATHHD